MNTINDFAKVLGNLAAHFEKEYPDCVVDLSIGEGHEPRLHIDTPDESAISVGLLPLGPVELLDKTYDALLVWHYLFEHEEKEKGTSALSVENDLVALEALVRGKLIKGINRT